MSPAPSGLSLFQGGPTSGTATGYVSKMARDAAGKRIFFLGGDHNDPQILRHLIYSEATNTWTAQGTPSFAGVPQFHGYEGLTWDSIGSRLFYRPYGTMGVYQWSGSGTSWINFSSYASVLDYSSAANGCEFHPGRGATGRIMVWQLDNTPNGELVERDLTSGAWSSLASGSSMATAGDPHNFMRYDHIRGLMYFGGGNGTSDHFTITQGGTITKRTQIPGSLATVGPTIGGSVPFVHPTTGNLVVIRTSTNWQQFNPDTNAWSAMSGTCQILTGSLQDSGSAYGTCSTTIPEYGVAVFIIGRGPTSTEMWLYKA